MLQSCVSDASPTQSEPPFAAGVSTARVRVWKPPPHVLVHPVHGPNGPHLQSTAIYDISNTIFQNISIRISLKYNITA